MDPELATLLTGLGQVAARNTGSAIYDRLTTIKAAKANQETVNQLTEIIDQLIEDKNELVRIARGLEQQLVAERISNEDIDYITKSVIPTIEKLFELQPEDEDGGDHVESSNEPSLTNTLKLVKSLITPETLTVLQLLGFSFRDGVGEPLTALCRRAILSQYRDPGTSAETELTQSKASLATLEIAQDNASFKRYKEMGQSNLSQRQ
jgi:hypothetical protein